MGAAMNKGLTFKMGQTHVHRYLRPLLEHIQNGEIDPSFVITHRLKLEEAPHGYEIFKHKRQLHQGCFETVKHLETKCVRLQSQLFSAFSHHPLQLLPKNYLKIKPLAGLNRLPL